MEEKYKCKECDVQPSKDKYSWCYKCKHKTLGWVFRYYKLKIQLYFDNKYERNCLTCKRGKKIENDNEKYTCEIKHIAWLNQQTLSPYLDNSGICNKYKRKRKR